MNIKDLDLYNEQKIVIEHLVNDYNLLPTKKTIRGNFIILNEQENKLVNELYALCIEKELELQVNQENADLFNRIMQLKNNSIIDKKTFQLGIELLDDNKQPLEHLQYEEETDTLTALETYQMWEIDNNTAKYIYIITSEEEILLDSQGYKDDTTKGITSYNCYNKTIKDAIFIYDTAKHIIDFYKKQHYSTKGIMQKLQMLDFNCYNLTEDADYEFFDFDFQDIVMTYNRDNGLETQVQIYINEDFEDFNIDDLKKDFTICPLCEELMTHKQIENTHIWSCNHCPNVMFEYNGNENLNNLNKFLGD